MRQLVKRITKIYHGSKHFDAIDFQKPPPGLLPCDGTEGCRAFQDVVTDCAGPKIFQEIENGR